MIHRGLPDKQAFWVYCRCERSTDISSPQRKVSGLLRLAAAAAALDTGRGMSTLHGTDERIAPEALLPGYRPPNLYLTDEVSLYRVVGLLGRGADEIVELEDRYGPDVVEVPIRDLRGRRLRVVTPTTASM